LTRHRLFIVRRGPNEIDLLEDRVRVWSDAPLTAEAAPSPRDVGIKLKKYDITRDVFESSRGEIEPPGDGRTREFGHCNRDGADGWQVGQDPRAALPAAM
jgi:hypothetical protein